MEIINYDVTDKTLKELADRCKNTQLTSVDEYKTIVGRISVTKKLRVGVEKKRKELKSDALLWGRKVDAEAKRITTLLFEIEAPMKEAKDSYDSEKLRVKEQKRLEEQERVERYLKAIHKLRSTAVRLSGGTVEDMLQAVTSLKEKELNVENCAEFLPQAMEAKNEALLDLEGMILRTQEALAKAKVLEEELIERKKQQEKEAEVLARIKEEEVRKARLVVEKKDKELKEREVRLKIEREALAVEEKERLEALNVLASKNREEANRLKLEKVRIENEKEQARLLAEGRFLLSKQRMKGLQDVFADFFEIYNVPVVDRIKLIAALEEYIKEAK